MLISPPKSPASSQHQINLVVEDVADILLPPYTQGDEAEVPYLSFPPPPTGILTPGTREDLLQLRSLPQPSPPLLALVVENPAPLSRTQQSVIIVTELSSSLTAIMQQPLFTETESGGSQSKAIQQSRLITEESIGAKSCSAAVTIQQAPSTSTGSGREVSQPLSSSTLGAPESRSLKLHTTQPLQPRASASPATPPMPLGIEMRGSPSLKPVPKAQVCFARTYHGDSSASEQHNIAAE